MNKKGFVFVETIIVITVLITALLLIYAGFVNVLNNEKVRSYYDDPVYLYRSIYLKSFLEKNNTNVLFSGVNENGVIRFNCNYEGLIDDYGDASLNTVGFCETLLSSINVENLYLTQYNISDFKNCPNFYSNDPTLHPSDICLKLENLMDYPTYDYFRTLRSYSDDNRIISGYRMTLVYKNVLAEGQDCESSTGSCDENEYLENYYSSLKLNDIHTENRIKTVTINVVNGSTPINEINILEGRSLSVKITPNNSYKTDHADIVCSNDQTGIISDGNFVISNVMDDTTCQITLPPRCSTADGTVIANYDYNGTKHTFTATCRGTYEFEAWGAQGGNSGGKGAHTKGRISVDANQKLYIYIGGTNGYNGGAAGGIYSGYDSNGGGATDIRLVDDYNALNSRIMVAGGGGASIVNGSTVAGGGAGGGVTGNHGSVVFYNNGCGTEVTTCRECDTTVLGDITCATGTSCGCLSRDATGGQQVSGGIGAHYLKYKGPNTYTLMLASNGRFGIGGVPGGGGGFYGGGGGLIAGNAYAGAGGGSSCVNGSLNVLNNYYDCSSNNFKFDNILIEANKNTGNGKVKVTLIESF